MFQFAREVLHLVVVLHLVETPGAPVPLEVSMRSSPNSHKVWCEKTWHHVIPTLELWLTQVQGLKVSLKFQQEICKRHNAQLTAVQ